MDKIRKPKPQRIVPPTETVVKTDEDDMTPTPEQTRRMEEIVKEAKTQERTKRAYDQAAPNSMRLGFASGGSVGSASKRADGCAERGKTKGRMV